MSNSLPFLSGFTTSLTIGEEDANLTPQLIDGDVTFVDADDNFDGGTLVLSGLLTDDIIGVRDQGTGAGQIGFSGGNITFAGTIIGTATGGTGTTLSVTFNADATSASIEALIENLTFSTLSDTPAAARTLDLTITDAAGAGAVAPVTFAVQVGTANPFDGIDVRPWGTPDFADLDGDGDLDLITGDIEGTLNYLENTGNALAPVYTERTGAANPFDGIDIDDFSIPSFADLDGDGDLDLVIGESYSILNYYENTGTGVAPVYTARTGAANPFDGINVFSYASPSLVDLDGDGDLDLVVGESDGTLSYCENTGTGLAPAYTERTGAANPFNGIDIGAHSTPSFADLDGDGDLDLVIGESEGALRFYENTGSAVAPVYMARTGAANPFNGIVDGFYRAAGFADLDGDGDLDLVTGELEGNLNGNLNYYRNTLTDVLPAFSERTGPANPFDGINVGLWVTPSFADLDGDGDLDLVIGESEGILNYYENTGTGLAPVYTARTGAANPYDGIDIGSDSTPSFADLDGDGDFDLVIGNINGTVNYLENTGSALAPVYTARTGAANPFNSIDIGFDSTPSFADLDGDGDFDLVIGESDGTVNYYENTGTGLAPVYIEHTGAANPFNSIDVGFDSTPSFADLDGDGDLDLVVGESDGGINYYENTGTGLAPVYTERTGAANPFNGINAGLYSTPSFADLDGDGDSDLVIGEFDGTLNYYENTVTNILPTFMERTGTANPFNGIDVGEISNPHFADLDGDGDLDMVIGEFDGTLNYYENTGTGLAPVFTVRTGAANPFDGIDTGFLSDPDLADLDGDGDLDLVVGRNDGALSYYENTGTGLAPAYTERTGGADPFDGINVGAYATSSLVDLDGDGNLDLVIGEFDGTLNYYENTGTGLAPAYTARTGTANPFNGIDVGSFSDTSFADIDGDGDLDLVIGAEDGTINYYENTGSAVMPNYVSRTGTANPFNGIDIGAHSTPSFADLDGDGDLDLVIGKSEGNLNYYENIGTGFRFVLNVTEFDDPAVAQDDAFAILETGSISGGDVLADNGNGADTDVDTPLAVTSVNGSAGGVGSQLTLASGALLTLNANGTFDYDPNGQFEHVPLNATDTDSFTYEVNGVEATVTVTITGVDNDDTVNGTSGADALSGGVGNDTVLGLDGDDTLIGGADGDLLNGGADNDTASYAGSDAAVQVSLADETATGGHATGDVLIDIENLAGSSHGDTLSGDGGANVLNGEGGNDTLDGGSGNDTLIGGAGRDSYDGGSGSDTVSFAGAAGWVIDLAAGTATTLSGLTTETLTSIENIIGSDGNDRITGTNRANDLDGGGGDDTLIGGGGIDNFFGGTGTDTVDLSGGNSKWRVDLGNDTAQITSVAGTVYDVDFADIEIVIGARNTNTVIGTAANETVTGQSFSDVFYTGEGLDQFDAGLGFDTISLGSASEGLTVRGTAGWAKTAGGATVVNFSGVENLSGTSHNDNMTGTSGRNILDGRAGDDTLNAGSGNDTVRGQAGDDHLTGGRGNDVIDGGADTDRAYFTGDSTDYAITKSGATTTVEWTGAGSGDGTDTLTNVEFLVFDDATIDVLLV